MQSGAVALISVVTAVTALAGCGEQGKASDTKDNSGQRRGELVSVTPLKKLNRQQIGAALTRAEIPKDTVRYGVSAYRLTYRTITPDGKQTTASGLLALPQGGGKRLSTVAYTHGTLAYRGDAPSADGEVETLLNYLYASGGRAAVAPDYLGLGKGSGRHPYIDTASSVSASLDMLRAARSASQKLDRSLNGDVYTTGFSQGGQVAVALGRKISGGVDPRFRLRGLAPISGPYDLGGETLPSLTDGRMDGRSAVFYLTYFLTAQNRLHSLYDSPREVFRAPYHGYVEDLFDGEHKDEEIVEKLPKDVKRLLTDEWYQKIQHPTGALRKTVQINDGVCEWKPSVPVRLYTATGDRDVPIGNTRSCAKSLAKRGVKAKVVDQGDVDHFGAVLKSIPQIAEWLAERQQKG